MKGKIARVTLSKYEQQILGGMKPRSEMQAKMIATAIENQLGATVTRKYADGTEVTASVLDQAIATAMTKLIDSGNVGDLLTLAKLMGQFKDAPTEVHVSKVDEDLEKRAIE